MVNLESITTMCLPDINLQRTTNDANLAVREEREA